MYIAGSILFAIACAAVRIFRTWRAGILPGSTNAPLAELASMTAAELASHLAAKLKSDGEAEARRAEAEALVKKFQELLAPTPPKA